MPGKSLLSVFAILTFCLLTIVPLTACRAATEVELVQTEEQALQTLRRMTKDGKLPPEAMVLQIEQRFANLKTGALAKLLRARIRLEANNAAGAADILNSSVFQQKTAVGDYALWMRGKALQQIGRHAEAMKSFEQLAKDYPDSLKLRESKLLWAQSALASGQGQNVAFYLQDLVDRQDGAALLAVAQSFEQQGNPAQGFAFYRRAYFYGAGTDAGKQAEAKLTAAQQSLAPQTVEEIRVRAERFDAAKNYAEAQKAYDQLAAAFPSALTPKTNLKRLTAAANLKNGATAQTIFFSIPVSADEKKEASYQLVRAYANAKQWAQARTAADEMRRNFASSDWTVKALAAAGMIAREQKNKFEESYFLKTALAAYPNAVEVAPAQFELAWLEHDNKNFAVSSQMLTEHLARYVDKDNTYRGRAGYWAARDSERAGKIGEACQLYDALAYRYGANWYGYLAKQKLANLKASNRCPAASFPENSLIGKAAANLKTVTVAKETVSAREQPRIDKADELSIVGLFDWSLEELNDASRTAPNSPRVNLAVARLYRAKEDNVEALRSLARSYPDYSQMFPEEMSRDEWEIFYPLNYWEQIKLWAANRKLDPFQVAGFIRQESVFYPRAKSRADAYGLMQLLIPTARGVARKYGTEAAISAESLYQPALNIELGTGYIRDQYDKFGQVEYVAVAYNAGPGKVPQWRSTLPYEMDEFVEAIPFSETRSYVQGIIRNSAQYRRLYDESGNFQPNVGSRPLRGEIDSKPADQFALENPEIVLEGNKGE